MFGERLKLARKGACLSLRDLAKKVGVSAQTISKYERNLVVPSSEMILRLGEALGVKPEYFFRLHTEMRIVPAFRKRARLPKKEKQKIIARIQEWLERYLEVDSLFATEITAFQFPKEIYRQVKTPADAERVATELRAAWGLGFDPIENLMEVLEEHGIKIGLVEGTPEFDACTFWADHSPVMAVKQNLPGDRQRFNLAHELGHLVLTVDEEDLDLAETAAYRFAGAFLAPAPRVHQELGNKRHALDLGELALLKKKYGLSMQGWIYRAKDLGIISETTATQLFRWFRRRGYHQQEPGVQLPPEEPQRLERLVRRALAEDLISPSRAAELLAKPILQL